MSKVNQENMERSAANENAASNAPETPAKQKKGAVVVRWINYVIGLAFVIVAMYSLTQPSMQMVGIVGLVVTAISVALATCLAVAAIGKAAWLNGLQVLLTVVYAILFVTAGAVLSELNGLIFLILAVVVALVIAIGLVRIYADRAYASDLVRYILELIVALVLAVVLVLEKLDDNKYQIFALIAAAVTILQLILVAAQIKASSKKEVAEAREATEKEVTSGFTVEEYAVAYPYEGGPVAGVEMAQEVNPTYTPGKVQPVATAGYDFYNCKSFDPFIATLDNEERNQFTELFILKYKGVMPEIPDYEVGGDNREFFRKVFIYLGQYRDRIPNGLLTKMYNFSVKLS